MFRFLFRTASFLVFVAAFVSAVIDAAKTVAVGETRITTLGVSLYTLSPGKLQAAQALVERRLPAGFWDQYVLKALLAPTAAALGALGLILFVISRRRPPPIGYSNRDVRA